MKKIILTGGGTAGHVIPNLALLPKFKEEGFEVFYIGSKTGLEKDIIKDYDIKYYGISVGKLRRYFDLENFKDVFRILKGIEEANKLVKKIKPDIIFSKGGFVSFPVTVAGKLHKVPVIIHESDITPGLANKLAFPFCKHICTTFPETLKYVPEEKSDYTGAPIREELFHGNFEKGYELCGFKERKPVILIMGGSLGSVTINENIKKILPSLLKNYNVVHIVGKGNFDNNISNIDGYKQFEYINTELPHIFSIADLVISRAGATAIFEFLALKKLNILIPLSRKASRGDQILNANSFKNQGFSFVIEEEDLTDEVLLKAIEDVFGNKDTYFKNMESNIALNSRDRIMDIILKSLK